MPNFAEEKPFREERTRAFLLFAFFCIALIGAYITVKVDITNRPIPKPTKPYAPQAGPMQGKTAPDFALPDLYGNTVKLADYKGKVLFINVWATWCDPCRDEMPSMERLYSKIKGPKFEMLAISVDKDGAKSVEPFVKELGLSFPVLLDPHSETANRYKVTGVPETFIVNEKGVILFHMVGPADWDKPSIVEVMKKYIEKAAAST